MTEQSASLTASIWNALGGDRALLESLSFDGDGALPSAFRVTDLASASIAAASLAVAELVSLRSGALPKRSHRSSSCIVLVWIVDPAGRMVAARTVGSDRRRLRVQRRLDPLAHERASPSCGRRTGARQTGRSRSDVGGREPLDENRARSRHRRRRRLCRRDAHRRRVAGTSSRRCARGRTAGAARRDRRGSNAGLEGGGGASTRRRSRAGPHPRSGGADRESLPGRIRRERTAHRSTGLERARRDPGSDVGQTLCASRPEGC